MGWLCGPHSLLAESCQLLCLLSCGRQVTPSMRHEYCVVHVLCSWLVLFVPESTMCQFVQAPVCIHHASAALGHILLLADSCLLRPPSS